MTTPISITVEIDLDEHLAHYQGLDREWEPIIGQTTLADVIIREAARQVAHTTATKLTTNEQVHFRQLRDEAIRAELAPAIAKAVHQVLQPTDSFGRPNGEAKSLEDLIIDQAADALKRTDRSNNNGRSSGPGTVLDQIIADNVGVALRKELQPAINDAVAAVKEAISKVGADMITDVVGVIAKKR